jgi:hypothetical protein
MIRDMKPFVPAVLRRAQSRRDDNTCYHVQADVGNAVLPIFRMNSDFLRFRFALS